MLQAIKKGFQKLDMFGQTITLNMNRNDLYTTSFGGFSSILIICLLSLIFYSNIISFFQKQNIYHGNEVVFSNDPGIIEMDEKNSMIAISIDQPNFTTNPFFQISLEQRIYSRNLNGTIEKSSIEIPLKPCTLDRFNNIFSDEGINFTDQFNFQGIGNMLCPIDNFKYHLQGTYSSQIFKFLKISVKSCKSSDIINNNFEWNPICASDQDRQNYLNENSQFKLQIIQINTVINPQNPENYKTIYIDSDMYFPFVPHKLARLANIFYRQVNINNDNSLLPFEKVDKEEIIMRKAEDYRDLTELGRDTDDNYAIVYLRRSPFTEIVNRRFQKIGELLSYLGGFMQIMKVLFGFLIAFYNRTSMLIELANKLYDFKEEKDVKKLRTINTVQYIEQISSPIDVFQINGNQLNQNHDLSNIEWKDYLSKLVQKSDSIKFNFKLFINQLTFGFCFKDKNSKFLQKAIEKINNELDLHTIFYQLHEINKLKQVLLRKSQIILFNFSPKPIITLGIDQAVPSRLTIKDSSHLSHIQKTEEEFINEELFSKLQQAYKEILNEINQNPSNLCQMNINLKLTQLIGQDFMKLILPFQQRRNGFKLLDSNLNQETEL
ncbi:unnamed protein product [Paramecium primaurelia]|uniref:Transmembrane protein n=1 Tax=Paramecium primaurelia TaxID=5886 RepID=A0A8S1NWD7_PARPR|nr:unnamed protein product [Paramecium primaurelia]